jgi:hypothetical protein
MMCRAGLPRLATYYAYLMWDGPCMTEGGGSSDFGSRVGQRYQTVETGPGAGLVRQGHLGYMTRQLKDFK